MIRIFVYGTLRHGNPNHHVMTNVDNGVATFVCNANTTQKYPLVIATTAGIPFILNKEGVGEHVNGEIYDVDEQMKVTLDKMEMEGVFYDRHNLQVTTEEKQVETCATYVLNNAHDTLFNLPMLKSYSGKHIKSYVPKSIRETTIMELIGQVKPIS